MTTGRYHAVKLAPGFYQLGTPAYPAYLSTGKYAAIIEGGIAATTRLILEQIDEIGFPRDRIKYVFLTHAHLDHIGAVPLLRQVIPGIQIVAGQTASEKLASKELIKAYVKMESLISEILLIKGEIESWPIINENPVFTVDRVVQEGDILELGNGISWEVYETPGHSSCHISYFDREQKIVTIGDATGLYDFHREIFWPTYLDNLEAYCQSIRKLYRLQAQIGVLSHNGAVTEDLSGYFNKAIKAAESYHTEIITRVKKGEKRDDIALDLAKRVFTFTNLQPFESILSLVRSMMEQSIALASRVDLFNLS